MSTPAFTRLQRILDLEERQSWRNRSVIGGMRAMAARWTEDARSEGVDPQRVAALAGLMQRYDAEPAARPQIAADMRAVMADDGSLVMPGRARAEPAITPRPSATRAHESRRRFTSRRRAPRTASRNALPSTRLRSRFHSAKTSRS